MLQEQQELLEKTGTKGKSKSTKEPSKILHLLAGIGKTVGTTMLTAFLTGAAMAAGASAWAAVSPRRPGDLVPLKKVG